MIAAATSGRLHGHIMTEGHLGRLLPACLHQAIADVLPQRLEFYEEWLDPVGLRDGSIGLAPISAVIGFLRTEGERLRCRRRARRAAGGAVEHRVAPAVSAGALAPRCPPPCGRGLRFASRSASCAMC